jgi:uncharacterized protein
MNPAPYRPLCMLEYVTVFRKRSTEMWDSRILNLGDDTILVECGPMRMFIDGSRAGIRRPDLCTEAARHAIGFLAEIAEDMPHLKQPAVAAPPASLGRLARIMWEATALVGDADLTPMAAVAGTIADATADFLWNVGLTRVIVNNGGDLALRLDTGETVSVGIRQDVTRQTVSSRVVVTHESHIGGVCTSGLGGRSFTRGVASAAIVLAGRSAVADAAATAVANATYIPSPAVEQRNAETIDPETDLKGVPITTTVGTLSKVEIEQALSQGISRGEELVRRNLIAGACVCAQGRRRSTSALSPVLEPFDG